jgi:hypothetical protein
MYEKNKISELRTKMMLACLLQSISERGVVEKRFPSIEGWAGHFRSAAFASFDFPLIC